ncbi:hypothetical protein PP175_15725 [Aneurinibacillus sp. Ricciae_BoGa-3]|uniref:hypothetical protein n=1 Tax=Aneurinibacillus sp. Ricciae_BoGa-3 TaxID=3022697 RepID=UPI002341181F|nr:hypothetical protein [Aneurinibacillus sp. Ricciae_BoGa-3]WCK52870.1 hypothetical protein PP175_15725 [Aneurinibacillus sp. Ricciae_BoGa-3]
MSLRNVELQIAIPRTQELGKMQDDIQQHPRQEQAGIAMSNHEQWKRDGSRPLASQESEATHLKERERENNKRKSPAAKPSMKRTGVQDTQTMQQNLHPYIGRNFDITF